MEQITLRVLSTTIKNDTVYQGIAAKLEENIFYVNKSQVKDKRKYMKMRFVRNKDNMQTTGAFLPIF